MDDDFDSWDDEDEEEDYPEALTVQVGQTIQWNNQTLTCVGYYHWEYTHTYYMVDNAGKTYEGFYNGEDFSAV